MLRFVKSLARRLLPWTVRRAWYCLRAAQGKGRCPCAKPATPTKPKHPGGAFRAAIPGGEDSPVVHLIAVGVPRQQTVAALDAVDDVGRRLDDDYRVVLTTDDEAVKELPLPRGIVNFVMAEGDFYRLHPDGDWGHYLRKRVRKAGRRYRPTTTMPVAFTVDTLAAIPKDPVPHS